MRALLRSRGFVDLFVGQAVSAFGDWMVTIALMALVLKLSGSSTAVGAVLVLRLMPAVVAGPIVARVARDRDRRKIMISSDVARAVIVALIPLVRGLWWVYLWTFALEVGGLVFLPARDASIPDLVADKDLPLANGVILGSSYGTIPLGAGAFAAVSALAPHRAGFLGGHPFALVFYIDALTFVVSYLCIRRLTMLSAPFTSADVESESHGFRAAFRIPLVRAVIVPTAAIALGLGSLFSLGIVFVREVLRASDTEFGVLIALFGVGASFGLGLLRIRSTGESLRDVRVGVAVQGGTVAVMSLAPSIGPAFLGAAGFGAATAWALAAGMSYMQEALDGEQRVLAFTAFHVVIRAGLALAAIGSGAAADGLREVHWPGVGRLSGTRVVLGSAGVLVFLTSGFVRRPFAGDREPAP